MKTLTIELTDDLALQLEEMAGRLGVSVEQLIRISLRQALARPDQDFERAANYALQKNAELYQRLA